MANSFTDWEGTCLVHYGIPGMRWGVRKARKSDWVGKNSGESLFVSGSSKTQDKHSSYYRRKLPKMVRQTLESSMKNADTILVGDAPGIDRQVQNYLKKRKYDKVEVYGPGKKVRYSADEKWKTNAIDDPDHEEGSKEWLAKKDEAMSKRATKGLAVVLDEGSRATRKNVERLMGRRVPVDLYELNKIGKSADQELIYSWVNGKLVVQGMKHERPRPGEL